MSKIIKEEISRINYLFEYKRGVVISEQPQIVIDDTNNILKQNPGSFLTTNEKDNLEVAKKESNRLAKEKASGKKIENLYYKVTQKGSIFKIYRIDKVYEEPNTDIKSPEAQQSQNTETTAEPNTQTQEEQISCDTIKFLQERPENAKSFYDKLSKMYKICGRTCVNLKPNATAKEIAKQYYDAGNEAILCGIFFLLNVYDENDVYYGDEESLEILNELLTLCESNWRFEGRPLKIKNLN